jgi:hypothetical protein
MKELSRGTIKNLICMNKAPSRNLISSIVSTTPKLSRKYEKCVDGIIGWANLLSSSLIGFYHFL